MVALVSGRVWAQLSDEDKGIVRAAAQQHCDATIDSFVDGEAGKLERLKAIEGVTVTEDVGQEFFGDIVERWDAKWSEETPYVAKLRALAASF
jgi:TRAP-type C4-dicarboxylate transport system substrate-binding protein